MRDSSASCVSAQAIKCFITACQHSSYAEQALNHYIHFMKVIASRFLRRLRGDQDRPPCHHLFETIGHEHDDAVNSHHLNSFGPSSAAAFWLKLICFEP